tara:strand:+ start:305 stop:820 length:516 start_codon:yes stop_codon:yes gene_type:complete
MGEQSSTPDAPPSRAAAKKKRQRQDQEAAMLRLAEAEDDMEKASSSQIDESNEDAVANQRAVGRRASGFYVRSSSGNMVRSASSGNAVLSSAGSRALGNIRAGFDSDTKGYMKNRTTISSDDDASSPDAKTPMKSVIDPIQTAGLSSAAKRNLFGQDGNARARRKLMNTII